ncbi:putative Mce family protein [Nocardia jinanensis]|uniref:Mce family protein n=2 Tax=Nocardia jinanensis TaxID=382504 RepID=A0A917VSU0_9NOCA|nr:putative Mce family protein [Nocardia jinanensis]
MSRSRTRLRDRAAAVWGNDVLLGTAVVVAAMVLVIGFAGLYLRPFGQQTITFETTDASAIETGQDVRVAGISVGKVTDISIGADSVTVRTRIDDAIRIGNLSRIEVRMLTPVGGYAVTLIPLGTETGTAAIPVDRVVVPYSIGDVLQSSPTVTDEVDTSVMHANLRQVAQALEGNSTSLRTIVDGMNAVTGVLDQQRLQIHQIAGLAAEYLHTFNVNRGFVFELIGKIDSVLTTYHNNSAGFNYAYHLLGSVLSRLQPMMAFYLGHSEEVFAQVRNLQGLVTELQQHLAPAIDNLTALRTQLEQWLTPAGMAEFGGGVLTNSLCIPMPGREC